MPSEDLLMHLLYLHAKVFALEKGCVLQMQLASKTKGQKDDVTVIVIDAMPSEDMRMPPALQQKKSTSTMIAR